MAQRRFGVVVRNEEGRVVAFPVETGLQIFELRRAS
jgi:hypothetical protein